MLLKIFLKVYPIMWSYKINDSLWGEIIVIVSDTRSQNTCRHQSITWHSSWRCNRKILSRKYISNAKVVIKKVKLSSHSIVHYFLFCTHSILLNLLLFVRSLLDDHTTIIFISFFSRVYISFCSVNCQILLSLDNCPRQLSVFPLEAVLFYI